MRTQVGIVLQQAAYYPTSEVQTGAVVRSGPSENRCLLKEKAGGW